MSETEGRASRERGVLARVSELGASAQASIPGLYAWGVTVAPAAFAHGAFWLARITAIFAVASLGVAAGLERSRPKIARIVSIWGLVGWSSLTWLLCSAALTPAKMDATRGVLGVVGWLLFAFASSAPAVPRSEADAARVIAAAPLRPRGKLPPGDSIYLGVGIVLALALQAFGWSVVEPERAVLLRLVGLASGLTVLGSATELALARHQDRRPASTRRRFRRAAPWLIALALLGSGGAIVAFAR